MESDKEYEKHRRRFRMLHRLLHKIIIAKFNFDYDDLSNIEGPYLLMANHTTDYDPLLVGVMTGNMIYYVASEHLLHIPVLGRFVRWFMAPIIHRKGKQGINTIKEMMTRFKAGANVCLFPEGNRTFNGVTMPIAVANGKIVKTAGVKLVTVRFSGGYYTQPRWSCSLRRGTIEGRIAGIYEKDELKSKTPEEIADIINRDLYEDAYKTQQAQMRPFKGRNLAECIESTLFLCPQCKKIGGLHSHGDLIKCECGLEWKYNIYGQIVSANTQTCQSVAEWDSRQKEQLRFKTAAAGEEEILFGDKVILRQYGADGLVSREEAYIEGTKSCLKINGQSYSIDDIKGMAIHSRSTIIMYVGEELRHIEITGSRDFSGLKYIYLHDIWEKGGR